MYTLALSLYIGPTIPLFKDAAYSFGVPQNSPEATTKKVRKAIVLHTLRVQAPSNDSIELENMNPKPPKPSASC